MDLEILEALALTDDRTQALTQLLPGSEDHDYFRCLHAQHRGALDEADQILEAWPGRHGEGERYERLRKRQLWYRLGEDPARVADDVRDDFGVEHWHEPEAADVDPTRPTQLAADAFDGAKLLARALDYGNDLGQVTDEGLYELLGKQLDESRRRTLLARIGHTAQPELVSLVADDLDARGSGGFGSLRLHGELTLEQLDALAARRAKVTTERGWIDARLRRMRPPLTTDLELDRRAREVYLRSLWSFVSTLGAASNSLKAHVLWHLLDTIRRRDVAPELALVIEYLKLPRSASFQPARIVERVKSNDEIAVPSSDFRSVTDLPQAGDDEQLVRDLLQLHLANVEQLAPHLERSWLEAEVAIAQLLAGAGDADRATLAIGPARAAELRERIELAWSPHNPTRFGADEPIVLDADVKHVPELVVKVFRIDPLAYFQHHRREVATDLDLDGLAASHELVLRFTEPAVRRVRRRIELPMCARPGTYVIDLIGNGIASRALVHKGRLRHGARTGAAGHVITVLDDAGNAIANARAWIGDREYRADERGSFVVPFSTSPGKTPMLLSHGDIATVATLELERERYALGLRLSLDRQSLTDGATVRAIARVSLTVAGVPASLALLDQPTWEVTLTDRHGVASTKQFPLELSDDDAAVLEWPLGEATAYVAITIRGKVKVVSEQRDEDLAQSAYVQLATMHQSLATDALYLARTPAGWVLSALGKSGEPRAQRPLTVTLVHRWTHLQHNVELATDASGRCVLGELPGVVRISATFSGTQQSWQLDEGDEVPQIIATTGDAIVAVPATRSAAELVTRASLVEVRAGNAPLRHVTGVIEPLAGALAIRGLPPGDYSLRYAGNRVVWICVAAAGVEVARSVVTPGEVVELSRQAPAITEVSAREDLHVTLANATPRTRVHVIATRFYAAPIASQLPANRLPKRRYDREQRVAYVSGRELGDEYRYVLERRNAKRFPTLQLDKPSLLLNPWSRRTTSTEVAVAATGRAFAGAPAPAPRMAAPGAASRVSAGQVDMESYLGYDFVAEAPVVLANLVPDGGSVHVPLAELGGATCVTIVVDDPAGTNRRYVTLGEQALAPRDLRLKLALDPARHASQQKTVAPLRPGETLVIADLATAKVHLVDSVERAHAYLLALRDDETLREWAFVTRWHKIADSERRELYTKYACHELHLFLYCKDRPFFDAVVRPYLAHKRTKTFLDHWLLDAELTPYLEPARLVRLNAVERALLAQRLAHDPALVRLLADEVAIIPPDPALDTRTIDVLLGGATLDADSGIAGAASDARMMAEQVAEAPPPPMQAQMLDRAAAFAAPAAGAAKPKRAREAAKKLSKGDVYRGGDADELEMDMERRRDEAPMYRAADRTQEWAEHNWWHKTPAESNADLIVPNRLWRDLAQHTSGSFLSPWLGLASASFAEAMCALAVVDLPFVAAKHALAADGPRLAITAASNALAGSSQIVDGELVTTGAPLVVGQSYVRTDDRYRWVDGEQLDKYVEGSLIAGIVYTCQVVLANPTSSRQRIAALVQIPRGSIALAGARQTHTIDVLLEPYGTHGHEYAFYFPVPGPYTHFPVHVSRGGTIVASAPPRTLDVTLGGEPLDPHSWPHISQRGTLAEVVTYLTDANLADTEVDKVAWRMRERPAYEAILAVLERRRAFDETLWGYALLHHDKPRIRTWLRTRHDELLEGGPVLEMPIVELDSEQLDAYEHLEYAPLTNARAHRLGQKLRILNDGLAAQYTRFLELVAHRRMPTSEDLLAAAAYLLAQDRYEAALAVLARVDANKLADQLQHDYLVAYAACLTGELPRVRELVTRWRELPVDRWRRKFEALASMLAELDGAAPQIVDPKHREQQQAELAAKQPAFEIVVDRDGVAIRQQHVSALELRFFEMDVELLFSRQPFVQSDVSRFSFIEPGHRETLTSPTAEQRIPWPDPLRGKNVVVEAVGAGQRKAKIHYANDLATNLSHQYGQLRVQRASDRAALAATYVKVYAKKRGGQIAFYKDGYTDLRGWFDYATLSTDDLDHVERFAILVCSDQSGSAILEANPPAR